MKQFELKKTIFFSSKISCYGRLQIGTIAYLEFLLGFSLFLGFNNTDEIAILRRFQDKQLIHRKTGVIFKPKMKLSRSPNISTYFHLLYLLSSARRRRFVYIFWARNSNFRKPWRNMGHLAKGMILLRNFIVHISVFLGTLTIVIVPKNIFSR